MSRTIPRAYVTAAWSKNRVEAEDQARKYCAELVKAGYLPICPVLAFSGVISDSDPDAEKKRREVPVSFSQSGQTLQALQVSHMLFDEHTP